MTWQAINRQYNSVAPGFLKLIDLLLTIPATSAEAERGFSILKLTKTDDRNRMQNVSLNNLLAIKLLSLPEEAFDPAPAVNDWMKAKERRIRTSTNTSKHRGQTAGGRGQGDTPSTSAAADDLDSDSEIEVVQRESDEDDSDNQCSK